MRERQDAYMIPKPMLIMNEPIAAVWLVCQLIGPGVREASCALQMMPPMNSAAPAMTRFQFRPMCAPVGGAEWRFSPCSYIS